MDLSHIEGKCWLFGNNVDTDQIIQGRYLTMLDYSEMAKHTFEVPRPDFAANVKTGDVIVAGTNFGGGSSREEAPMILRELGVGCIIAESFARIFYRNGFNVGLPLMIVPEVTQKVKEGDTLCLNLLEGTLEVSRTREILKCQMLPKLMLDILTAGGAVKRYQKDSN